ncbi:MAG: SAM-dependent methyltransferase [Rhodospirillaceae bacterium]
MEGPLSVATFMMEALGHPRYGYYMTADRFGAAGDFVTAPEISQMFGELIGLWCADYWERLGRPDPLLLVELGPGRGTLMADALRAVSQVLPDFVAAVRIHLVETSPLLCLRQAAALAPYMKLVRCAPAWHDRLADVPEAQPLLVIANEFFDALPVRQFQRGERGWSERLIDLDPETEALRFVLGQPGGPSTLIIPPRLRQGAIAIGTVIDISPTGQSIALELGRRLVASTGAALIIDYGHAALVPTDTLQAVRRHAPVPVLSEPGETDITAHVDFAALAASAAEAGAIVHGPVAQGTFLRSLGIEHRAATLCRDATKAQAADIDAALHRLTANDAMGDLFKVMALIGPGQPVPVGF